ncbi:MAG TPA: glycosyltransferase family 2 protein [Candidatus Polarisedimenticolaceae bacterium]|nr:glycosyltransferase family 2 protein [Candidatus Polarisedimenticolaceae bacterium]
MNQAPTISLVIPIHDEEPLIDRLYREVVAAMEPLGLPWEAVFVDDGSRDRSAELLLAKQAADKRVVVVRLTRNWGHQPAIAAGLTVARGDAVVLMDGDLQDPPSLVPRLVAEWKSGGKVVIAERTSRKEAPLRKLLMATFYRLLGFLSDMPIPLNSGIFGLLDRQVVDALNRLEESNRYLPGLRAWVGFPTRVVTYAREARAAGEPKQTLFKLTRYALDAIFSFSYKPLRLSLVLGLTAATVAVIYGIVLVACRVMGVGMFGIPVVDGYTTTIVSILFLGGTQLICVGILGEYIGRIYDEVKRRPLFLIREVHRSDRDS